ncbi:MAG: DUF1461 domain-containing protein [Lachnospiraceae bacterium]|nr:DUF1461 domain-containing protein [Lachnospiraceae bacterium]
MFFILFDGCVYFVIFSKGYLNAKYKDYKVGEALDMSDEDLESVTARLVDFVKGKAESIDIEVSVRGSYGRFFNDKDISHMVDVKNIILRMRDLLVITSFAAFIFAIFLLLNKSTKEFRNGILIADGIIVLLAVVIVIAATTNLNWLIVFCHNIFFNNTNWLLDPKYDNLIFLCPEKLFIDAGKVCGAIWGVYILLITALGIVIPLRLSHRR